MSSAEIAAFENEVKEYRLQLETVQLGLQADPDNAELQELQTELEQYQQSCRKRRQSHL